MSRSHITIKVVGYVKNLLTNRRRPCDLCGLPTQRVPLCDRCNDLKTRIERDPEIARAILKGIP